jgi:DNA-binding transcriptional regulator GbsR (MarR family)
VPGTSLNRPASPKSDETDTIVERMGRHFEAEGVPRIGGRLYGHLLLQSEPKSLDDLAAELRVSKTSVSTNARLLEGTRLVERITKPGDRRDYYQAAPDQTKTLEFRLEHLRQLVELLQDAQRVVPGNDGVVQRRLTGMERFTGEAVDALEALLATTRRR